MFFYSSEAAEIKIRGNSLSGHSYDIALLYLEQTDYDMEAAVEIYKDDERWEKEHPMEINIKGKGKSRHNVGKRRFTGQAN